MTLSTDAGTQGTREPKLSKRSEKTPTTCRVGWWQTARRGACCSAAFGVCCLAPAPLVPASASVLLGAIAAALVAVVLRPPSADPIRREVVPEQEVPWSPDRPGERGPRGPPAG